MLALIVSIVLGVAYSHVLRHAQSRQRQMVWAGAVSYIVATAVMAVLCLVVRPAPVGWREAGYGVIGGLAWVATYWFFNLAIRLAGVSISQCVTWLAVTVPVLAGITVWGETPTWLQGIGLALVLLALALLLAEQPRDNPTQSRWRVPVLVAAFLAEAVNTLAMKAYTKGAPGGDDSGLLLYMFGSAAVGMVVAAVMTEARPRLGEAGHGTLLGAIIIVANLAFLTAMRQLPAPVMFPSFWAGSVVLTAGAAMWLWGERYRPRAFVGMALAVVAMVLLHL
jgi:drug/metabolite transporter (DMT)-like permease